MDVRRGLENFLLTAKVEPGNQGDGTKYLDRRQQRQVGAAGGVVRVNKRSSLMEVVGH